MRLGVFVPPWGPTARPEDFEAVAAVAERLGYPSLWVGDHIVFPRSVSSKYLYNESGISPFDPDQPLLDPMTLIAYLAGQTTRIGLGISVLVLPMRNPVEAAKLLADVQVLSGGRLLLGVGVGWMREEFQALGADFERRGSVAEEYVAILRHLWSGSLQPFEGTYHRFPALGFEPRPQPIPVIVGGNSRVAMRRAARQDGWHAIRMEPGELAPLVTEVRKMVAEAGGDSEAFSVVYRGPLLDSKVLKRGPDRAGRDAGERAREFLTSYRSCGVDEFIVEFPKASTHARTEWMTWLADEVPWTRESRLQ